MPNRAAVRVFTAVATYEGAGFLVHRPFPTPELEMIDPFLLLDEMGPMDLAPGEAKGAPDHPHRGFETVTYMISGAMEHRDSAGNAGRIGPGDVQWMTAGGGVIHSELPAEAILRDGGRMHGFQLWINLPRADKMMKPRYQEIPSERIPESTKDDGSVSVRVIAGEALGTSAVIDTRTPILYLHLTLGEGGELDQSVPEDFNGFVYVFEGDVDVEGTVLERAQMGVLGSGDRVRIAHSGEGTAQCLLIAGKPLGEPVSRYGPFVMNYHAEIRQAVADLQDGTFTGKSEG